MKKFLTFILVLAMVLSVSSVALAYANATDLQNAINSATDGDTITLTNDISLGGKLTISGKEVTIDGGGHTITWDEYNGTLFDVANGASLTLKDVTIDGGNAFTFYNDTTTVADGQNWYTRFVNVGTEDKAINADVIVNAGSLTLGEGTVIQNVTIASNGENGKTENTSGGGYVLKYNDDLAVIKSNGGKVSLSGANIIGNAGVILNAINAESTMTGATIEGNMGCGNKGGIIIANGGTMTIDNNTSLSSNKAMARSATILGVINGAGVTFSGTMNGNKHIGVGDNTAGAIVVLEGASKFVMDGGSISNNVGGRAGAIASRWVGGSYGQHPDTSIILNSGAITGNTATNSSWDGASIFLRSPAEINEGMLVDGIIEVNTSPAELYITGGTLNGSLIVDDTTLPVEITGGTFSEKPADNLIGDEYIALPSDNGNGYTIVKLNTGASIHVSPTTLDFESAVYGYSAIEPKKLVVTNDGSVPINVSVSNSSYTFTPEDSELTNIQVGGSVTFWVAPKTGLGVGIHDVKIEITVEEYEPTTSANPMPPTPEDSAAPTRSSGSAAAFATTASSRKMASATGTNGVQLLFTVTAPSGNGISVKYNGGNSFSTSKSDVPTGVEIDGVPVTFNGNGSNFSVGCISSDAKWVTVRWNSTSVTTNFTPDGLVECTTVSIPKTGDMSFWAAVAAFFGF